MDYPVSVKLNGLSGMLHAPHQARRWNCSIHLYLKIFLKKIDPAGGAATGTADDWDTKNNHGKKRNIVKWPKGDFEAWSERYQRECQEFWDRKFWLRPPAKYDKLDFAYNKRNYRPNAECRLNLSVVSVQSLADHVIEVVKLAKTETFFRSDSGHYDDRDLNAEMTNSGYMQRAHIHEVGHLLTLGHSTEDSPACKNNNDACYADDNVMGGGEVITAWDARPWQTAMEKATGLGVSQWNVSLAEVPPSTW